MQALPPCAFEATSVSLRASSFGLGAQVSTTGYGFRASAALNSDPEGQEK